MDKHPLILVVFFGIFHGFGGLAFGKGLRDRITGNNGSGSLILWGAIMGLTPILFDWFFLINNGQTLYGLIGPGIFVLAAIAAGIFYTTKLTRVHEKSFGAILMGGSSLAVGLVIIPYLLEQAQTQELGLEDYIFGGCIPIIFLVVGISFLWSGISAIQNNKSFDEHMDEREAEIEKRAKRK